MSGKNVEQHDPHIKDEAPFNRILSKYFLRPHETPEAKLAQLIDIGKPFNYEETLFYKVRSGKIKYGDPRISRPSAESEWWDMPWLREKGISRKGGKKHDRMLKLLSSFMVLFNSIKADGLVVDTFRKRIRSDKLTRGNRSCYIYVDGNRRMGIIGYLVHSGQLKIETIPVKLARCAKKTNCSWMPPKKAEALIMHPFNVLEI